MTKTLTKEQALYLANDSYHRGLCSGKNKMLNEVKEWLENNANRYVYDNQLMLNYLIEDIENDLKIEKP